MRNKPYFLIYCCICYSVIRKHLIEENALKVYNLVGGVSSNILKYVRVNLTHANFFVICAILEKNDFDGF